MPASSPLTMDAPGQSANTMNGAFRADLGAAVERLRGEREAVRGVIVTSAKDSFLAGGDLDELLTFGPNRPTPSSRPSNR